ncbi:MAG: hypothetical protein M5R41_11445 [Bacteroidia bacterium]|nr:hypothetical protein [Bacteroidia bacterium]MCZ7557002.1 hypothetical protein [Bacteroidia bacterium]
MRPNRTPNRQRRLRTRGLIHEIVERTAIVEDIKALFFSLLSQAQDLLRLAEDGCVDGMMARGFLSRASMLLNDVRTSIQELGDGEEERRLLGQATKVENIIRQITDLCLDDDLLTERWR